MLFVYEDSDVERGLPNTNRSTEDDDYVMFCRPVLEYRLSKERLQGIAVEDGGLPECPADYPFSPDEEVRRWIASIDVDSQVASQEELLKSIIPRSSGVRLAPNILASINAVRSLIGAAFPWSGLRRKDCNVPDDARAVRDRESTRKASLILHMYYRCALLIICGIVWYMPKLKVLGSFTSLGAVKVLHILYPIASSDVA